MLIKIIAVQAQLGERLSLEEKIHLFRQRPDFVCLPEYFLIDRATADFRRAALHYQEHFDYLRKLSEELCLCLIAGTVVEPEGEHLYNTCFVFKNGEVLGQYRKRSPVPGEIAKGISPGNQSLIIDVEDTRIGVMICGDVFNPNLYEEFSSDDVDLIFVPTTSPYRPDDSLSQKRMRDKQYFTDGARLALSYVVKTCGVGTIFGHPLQGRSLIAAPWGILDQVGIADEQNPRILTAILDIAELRDFRRKFRLSKTETANPRISYSANFRSSDPEKFNAPLYI